MIFNIIIIAIIGVVAYFHYVQGFFSATLSAICAILASMIALSYQETVVEALLKGKVADSANAMITVALFALSYVILRVIFDKLIPGNVRVPVMVDKVGSGAMGVVAGLFAGGTMAIAAQMLPFGTSVGGYTRQDVGDRDVTANLPGIVQAQSLKAENELKVATLDPAKTTGLWISADDLVIGLLAKVSDDGSLAGSRPLTSVHPDYLGELFGQRLGIQVGAKHTASNVAGQDQITPVGVYRVDNPQQIDSEPSQIRGPVAAQRVDADPNKIVLVFRLNVSNDATDTDNRFRFSLGSIRLCMNGKNYIPVGTIETTGGSPKLYLSKPDDYLMMASGAQGVDVAFVVDRSAILTDADPKAKDFKIKKGAFLEVKRLARVDVGDRDVEGAPPTSDKYSVQRKVGLEVAKPGTKGASPAGGGTSEGPRAPLVVVKAEVSNKLFSPINTGAYQGDPANITLADGSAVIRQKKFAKLELHPQTSVAMLAKGDFLVSDLFEPEGKKMVQVYARPSGEPWTWGDKLASFELVDSTGAKYKPAGAWAKVKQGTSDRIIARFNADSNVSSIDKEGDGRPMDVWVAFMVPSGKQVTDFQYNGESVGSVNVQVP